MGSLSLLDTKEKFWMLTSLLSMKTWLTQLKPLSVTRERLDHVTSILLLTIFLLLPPLITPSKFGILRREKLLAMSLDTLISSKVSTGTTMVACWQPLPRIRKSVLSTQDKTLLLLKQLVTLVLKDPAASGSEKKETSSMLVSPDLLIDVIPFLTQENSTPLSLNKILILLLVSLCLSMITIPTFCLWLVREMVTSVIMKSPMNLHTFTISLTTNHQPHNLVCACDQKPLAMLLLAKL